jgi:hypothetical protein
MLNLIQGNFLRPKLRISWKHLLQEFIFPAERKCLKEEILFFSKTVFNWNSETIKKHENKYGG